MKDADSNDTPDGPIPFGYKNAWFAVSSQDATAIAKAIGLRNSRMGSWPKGIAAAYGNQTFVTPPVQGWVLVVGAGVGENFGSDLRPWGQLLSLSSSFGEAQVFCTHRIVDLHVWAKAEGGRLVRAYGYLGERGETLYDEGEETEDERALGFRFFDERSPEAESDAYWEREDLSYPDEDSVMAIARRWSLAPIDLTDSSGGHAFGVLGTLE